jgi:hypothetical protein
MKPNQKGAFNEGILILVGLSIVLFVFILPAKTLGPTPGVGAFRGFSGTNTTGPTTRSSSNNPSYTSSYSGEVRLSTGSAAYATDPSAEYISIINQSDASINITGWKLQNAKNKRTYLVGGTDTHFQSDVVTIPGGTRVLSPSGRSILDAIVLKKYDEAVIVTGPMAVQSPYPVVSFKENMCSGYLENLSSYDFTPTLRMNCPRPEDEAGFANLDRGCQNFLRSFPLCHTPTYGGVDQNRQRCTGCVDGRDDLSSSCIAFIKSHENYPSCVALHEQDPEFEGTIWHIFLNQKWELWDKDNDTISLFDNEGNLVTSYTY